ncbi:MAG: alpha/beta fold hydrolase [Bacteroidota bacterium]
MLQEEKILLSAPNNIQIALWNIKADTSLPQKHVFLTHGTFSNRKVCMGMADFLCQKGYNCWILEWRNHGESSKTEDFSFEQLANEDFKLAFDYLFQQEGIKYLDCITHSGGGILLTLYFIFHKEYIDQIKSITTFACQSYGAANNLSSYLKVLSGHVLGGILGKLPSRYVGGVHDEPHVFMKQWNRWNMSGRFTGDKGRDYTADMNKIHVPVLAIAGGGDTFIAPENGCRKYWENFPHPANQFWLCSKENGFRENYSHSRVMHSRNAAEEIYPKVFEWLEGVK